MDNNFNTTKTQESFNEQQKGVEKISMSEIDRNSSGKEKTAYQEVCKMLHETNDNEILDIHISKIEEAHPQESLHSQPSVSVKD